MVSNVKQPDNVVPPMIQFDPAQQRLMRDQARVIVVNYHRQKGKDFCASAKAVSDGMTSGEDWFIISLTQRQADATFRKCLQWAKAYKAALKMQGQIRCSYEEFKAYDSEIDQHFVFKAREIILPSGARIVSLPGRDPDTLAGLTGNVIFTEFGLFPKGGYEHWRVVFPLTTRGFRCIVISTPRGKNTKFYELFSDPETYSVHFCDIHQSIAEGFVLTDQDGEPCDLETFKKLYGDPVGFAREYECKFTGDLEALVTWAQLETAGDLGRDLPFNFIRIDGDAGWSGKIIPDNLPRGGRLEIGWDVARSRHLSSVWCNYVLPNMSKQLAALVVMRNCGFSMQRHVIRTVMDHPIGMPAVGCGDKTGLGMESNEKLEGVYADRWFGVTFSTKTKSELGSALKTAFDDGDQAIPPVDGPYKFVATDIYAIQHEETGGQDNDRRLRLAETPNPLLEESHCDIAYSGALARLAGRTQASAPGITILGVGDRRLEIEDEKIVEAMARRLEFARYASHKLATGELIDVGHAEYMEIGRSVLLELIESFSERQHHTHASMASNELRRLDDLFAVVDEELEAA